MIQQRRVDDNGVLCRCAGLISRGWDWFDKRDIDKHIIMAIVIYGTIRLTLWATNYVDMHSMDSGADVGLKVAAVLLPWNIIAAPAIKWYFESRPTG